MDKFSQSIPVLVAVVIAARKTGDNVLCHVALNELRETHGVTLTFASDVSRKKTQDIARSTGGDAHAS